MIIFVGRENRLNFGFEFGTCNMQEVPCFDDGGVPQSRTACMRDALLRSLKKMQQGSSDSGLVGLKPGSAMHAVRYGFGDRCRFFLRTPTLHYVEIFVGLVTCDVNVPMHVAWPFPTRFVRPGRKDTHTSHSRVHGIYGVPDAPSHHMQPDTVPRHGDQNNYPSAFKTMPLLFQKFSETWSRCSELYVFYPYVTNLDVKSFGSST
jgi:hypothetical protein